MTGLAVLGLVFSQTTDLNGWSQVGAARGDGRPHPDGRDHRHAHPAEHGAADERRPPGHARLRADQAGRRPGARQRPGVPDLAGGRRRSSASSSSASRSPSSGRRSGSVRARVRGRAAPRRRDDLLLLADPDDGRVLDRPDGRDRRAVRGRLPVRPLAGHDLPRLAAVRPDVPRPDRVRGDGPGRGADLAADASRRSPSRRCSRSCSLLVTRWFCRFGLRRYSGASA